MEKKSLLLIFFLFATCIVFAQVNTIKYAYDGVGNRNNRTSQSATIIAQWITTGNIRCAKDTNNANTGYTEREEKDNNTSSNTYNQLRWVNSGYNLTGCPVSNYSNVAKSKSFTKNNCDIGYAGTNVTYNVPQGTYTSTVSTDDANQKAQTDVDTNGQDYANINGSCVLASPVTINLTSNFTTPTKPSCKVELIQNGTIVQAYNFLTSNNTIVRSILSGSYQLRFTGSANFKNRFVAFAMSPGSGWWDKPISQTVLTTETVTFSAGTTYTLTAGDTF